MHMWKIYARKLNVKCMLQLELRRTWIFQKNVFYLIVFFFFKSQFSYCAVVWMRHSCRLNYRKNALDQRSVPTIYNDKQVTFKELLDKDISV